MDHAQLLNEVRYGERLSVRTARFYRHMQVASAVLTLIGTSATLSALWREAPPWLSLSGAAILAVAGCCAFAARPGDKAAMWEAEAKRYARLRSDARSMDAEHLQAALDRVRESDLIEFEALREVAYNDIVTEVGQTGCVVPLTRSQKFFRALA